MIIYYVVVWGFIATKIKIFGGMGKSGGNKEFVCKEKKKQENPKGLFTYEVVAVLQVLELKCGAITQLFVNCGRHSIFSFAKR